MSAAEDPADAAAAGGGSGEARERALAGLAKLYADLDRELARIGPRCELSGRCCNFKESGLTLFATDLELAHLFRAVGSDPAGAAAAAEAERCPWWKGGLCHAREGRPLGCRVYFCDASKAAELEELSTRFHSRLKRLHEEARDEAGEAALPYRYAPFVARVRELASRAAAPAR